MRWTSPVLAVRMLASGYRLPATGFFFTVYCPPPTIFTGNCQLVTRLRLLQIDGSFGGSAKGRDEADWLLASDLW